MTRGWKMLIAFGCLVSACNGSDPAAPTADAKAVAAAHDRTAHEAMARWLQVIQGKDAQSIATFYTDDAVLMAPGQPMVSGREAVRQFWQSAVDMPEMRLSLKPQQIEFSNGGDLAVDRGSYRFSGKRGAQTLQEAGKYVIVWKKVGGAWKVAADIWNSDTPPSPA